MNKSCGVKKKCGFVEYDERGVAWKEKKPPFEGGGRREEEKL